MSDIKEEIKRHEDLLRKIAYSLNTFTFKNVEEKTILMRLLKKEIKELRKTDKNNEDFQKWIDHKKATDPYYDYDSRL